MSSASSEGSMKPEREHVSGQLTFEEDNHMRSGIIENNRLSSFSSLLPDHGDLSTTIEETDRATQASESSPVSEWIAKNKTTILRAQILFVLILSMLLAAMNALGQRTVVEEFWESRGVALDRQFTMKSVDDPQTVAFSVLWGLMGLFQFYFLVVLIYRLLIRPSSRKWFSTKKKSKEAAGGEGCFTSFADKILSFPEHVSVTGEKFWYAQAINFFVATLLQMERMSSDGGFSFLEDRVISPVRGTPSVQFLRACLISTLAAAIPICSQLNKRLILVLITALCNIGFTMDRLLLVRTDISNDSSLLNPENWYAFRQETWSQLISSIVPVGSLVRGLMSLDGVLAAGEERQLARDNDSEGAGSRVGNSGLERSCEEGGEASRREEEDVEKKGGPFDPNPNPRPSTSRPDQKRRVSVLLVLMRSSPFLLAAVAWIAFTAAQMFGTDCSHLKDGTCAWPTRPLWDFPACDCHSVSHPTHFDNGTCIDYKQGIDDLGVRRVQFLFFSMTSAAFPECAVTDGPFYEIIARFPMLIRVGAMNNAIELADQASLPYLPHVIDLTLSFNPVSRLTKHIRDKFPGLTRLILEYASISHVDDEFAKGLDFVVNLFGNPICGDTARFEEIESYADYSRIPTVVTCGSYFAVRDQGLINSLNTSGLAACMDTSKIPESTVAMLATVNSKCSLFQTTPNHECEDICSFMPFLRQMDVDGDGYLNFEEGSTVAPLYFPGLRVDDQRQYSCVISYFGCQPQDPVQDKLTIGSIAVALSTILWDERTQYVGTDCSSCAA